MQLKTLLVAAATSSSLGSAQSLTNLLSNTDSLSSLNALLGRFPNIASTLAGLSNVTLFAPNNAAISALQQSGALGNASNALIEAILTYHVVDGEVPAGDISETPVFAATELSGAPYTTVSGGQVVEAAVVDGDVVSRGTPLFDNLKEVNNLKMLTYLSLSDHYFWIEVRVDCRFRGIIIRVIVLRTFSDSGYRTIDTMTALFTSLIPS